MTKTVFFDLDGTLTDSGPGVTGCAKLALEHFGIYVPQEELRFFVGPPLRLSFEKMGLTPEQTQQAIALYRARYVDVGKFENTPYPGIGQLLARLQAQGHRLFVATSKAETTAREILEHFRLAEYFEDICGADLSVNRDTKEQVIRYLLEKTGALEHILMIGDTEYDVLGAAACGIPTIGVSWGYGERETIENAGAIAMADTMEALEALINGAN